MLVKAYPRADIPVVQLSLDVRLAPAERLEIGRKLAPLRDEGVLIMGTGNIVHNLSAMNWGNRDCAPFDWSARFLAEIKDAIEKDEPAARRRLRPPRRRRPPRRADARALLAAALRARRAAAGRCARASSTTASSTARLA